MEDTEEEYSVDKIVEESQKLQESASKTIKESSQKFKERYIDNDENTSGKLKEDVLKIGKIYFEGVENTADMTIEKSKEVGQQLLDEGKNIVKKVGDYVVPEEVVNVGFNNAVNQETPVASQRINLFSIEGAVLHGQKILNLVSNSVVVFLHYLPKTLMQYICRAVIMHCAVSIIHREAV